MWDADLLLAFGVCNFWGCFHGIFNRHGVLGEYLLCYGGLGAFFTYLFICNSARKENVTSICGIKWDFAFQEKTWIHAAWIPI